MALGCVMSQLGQVRLTLNMKAKCDAILYVRDRVTERGRKVVVVVGGCRGMVWSACMNCGCVCVSLRGVCSLWFVRLAPVLWSIWLLSPPLLAHTHTHTHTLFALSAWPWTVMSTVMVACVWWYSSFRTVLTHTWRAALPRGPAEGHYTGLARGPPRHGKYSGFTF